MSQHLEDLREALQQHLPNEDQELGVLTGFCVVAQWNDGSGDDKLTCVAGDIQDNGVHIWTVKGWLQHALDVMSE